MQSNASRGLSLAKQGLKDEDSAVQRVAIWTHGDAVVNSPDLFEDARNSIDDFVQNSPKESSALFALEEFFIPLRGKHSGIPEYNNSIQAIIDSFPGYIGLKRRAGNLIGKNSEIIDQSDYELERERIIAMTDKLPMGDDVKNGKYREAAIALLSEAHESNKFGIKMRNTWFVRELLWLDPSLSREVFDDLSQVVLGNKDGDLIRTTCVVIGDCLLLDESLSTDACNFVEDFFEITDNDGSQIVVAQSLNVISGKSEESNTHISRILPTLRSRAANKSVSYTVELLVEDMHG